MREGSAVALYIRSKEGSGIAIQTLIAATLNRRRIKIDALKGMFRRSFVPCASISRPTWLRQHGLLS